MTVDEVELLLRGERRWELVEGELFVMEPGGGVHGRAAIRTGYVLERHVEETEPGGLTFGADTGFVLSPDTVRAPDAAWVGPERLATYDGLEGFLPGAPDLVIEVTGANDTFSDVHAKAVLWIEGGARLVLVIAPSARVVHAYRPGRDAPSVYSGTDAVPCMDVLPGFSPRVEQLLGTS